MQLMAVIKNMEPTSLIFMVHALYTLSYLILLLFCSLLSLFVNMTCMSSSLKSSLLTLQYCHCHYFQ